MTTIIINDRTTGAKKMIEFLKTQSYVTIIEEKTPGAFLLKSMEEARTGKTTEYESTEQLFANLRRKANV